MTKTEKRAALDKLINDNAATENGFRTSMAKATNNEKNAAKICRQRREEGTLFAERENCTTLVYFATRALAIAFGIKHRDAVAERAKTLLTLTSRGPAKAVSTAEIIHTERTRYTVLPTPVQRNQAITHSFIHNGMGAM